MSKQSKSVDTNLDSIKGQARLLCDLVVGDRTKAVKESEIEKSWRQGLVDLVKKCATKDEASAALQGMSEHYKDFESHNKWLSKSVLSKRYAMLKKPLKVICGHDKPKEKSGHKPEQAAIVKLLQKNGWHKAYALLNEYFPSGLGRKPADPDGKGKEDADKGKAGAKANQVEVSVTAPEETEAKVREQYKKVLTESPTECARLMAEANETAAYNVAIAMLTKLTKSDNKVYVSNAEAALAAIEIAERTRREATAKAAKPELVVKALRESKKGSNATATQVTALGKAMQKAMNKAQAAA